ncbi:YlxR family protein [Corynebacterium liangguodongii]|uniref:DUF448 domain-containing protein n=1 Tax=Corynebacterium liangguodongii TaxID=2079535 RepID=A0A2S0WEL4_9CORY|nr:YlxR family protein [Corynebacterium liangguodongii]AWB84225.1 DUF448 domain-containing protein [Corynebacterium liangguodongii]PWC00328.1 YlxR family protein [Corynebacterium liangguodongii]
MPTRTCIATRETKPDAELLRVVADPAAPGRILPDPSRRLPGRGAWITPTLEALELAEKRRAFARALRVSTPVDVGHVRTYLASLANDPTKG